MTLGGRHARPDVPRRDRRPPTSAVGAILAPRLAYTACGSYVIAAVVLALARPVLRPDAPPLEPGSAEAAVVGSWAVVGILLPLLVGVALTGIGVVAMRSPGRRATIADLDALGAELGAERLIGEAVPDVLLPFTGGDVGDRMDGAVVSEDGRLAAGTLRRARDGFADWGVLALRLDRAVPNILLRRTRRGRRADELLAPPTGSQHLPLEGGFDRRFELFCPAGAERDALYVFTPDLMALMLDETRGLSAQLVDDTLVFSSEVPFRLADPAVRARLARIVDVVGAKALRQTARYGGAQPRPVPAATSRLLRATAPAPLVASWHAASIGIGLLLGIGSAAAAVLLPG